MNWNISAWSIRNPVAPVLLFVVLVVLGLMSFSSLPVMRFPNIDIPLVSVSITDAGVAPSELETQITKKVEDSVSNITGVKHVMSTITEGKSTTVVEFRLEVPTQRAVNDVKDAIDRIKSDLPESANTPIVTRIDVEGAAIQTFAVYSPGMTPEQLSWFVDDTVVRDLQTLKGVARVDRYGGVTREVQVQLDPDRLNALGVTADDVNRQLRKTAVDMTGGRGDIAGQEQAIRTLGNVDTIDKLAAMKISLPGGRQVRLSDLGTVRDHWEDPNSFARVDGKPVVAFGVFRAKGASDTEVAQRVHARLDELAKQYPDVKIRMVDDSVAYTYGNYESAMHTLLEGAALAVIVVLLFLRNMRATIVSAIALPLAALPTFWALDVMGFSLNLVSLLGLTLVVGILVDDAIVEIENIVRHMNMGKSPYRAALEAADEIGLAVIAISTTIIAVFVPVSFMGGVAGQYFKQFGLTVAAAVFFSLLVARLITPLLAAYWMRAPKVHGTGDGPIMRAYTASLRGTLRFRWLTVAAGLALFGVAMWGTQFLPSGFMPQENLSRLMISAELPPGTPLEGTMKATDRATELIRQIPEVKSVYVVGGASPTGTLERRRATIVINLVHKSERARTQKDLEPLILAQIAKVPDIRANFVNDRGSPEIELGIMGDNGAAVNKAARAIQAQMRQTGDFLGVTTNAALDRPEIVIRPRDDKLAELGLTTADLSQAVRVATIGDVDANLAKFTVGDRQIPIRVELKKSARENLGVLENLSIRTPSGAAVPLVSVADIHFGQGPSAISRYNRQRRVVIGASMAKGLEIGEGLKIAKGLEAARNMPAGVTIQETGDAEVMGEVFASFRDAMVTGLLLVLVVLILLFGSVFHAFTILASLPLSIGGVVLGLYLTNNSISMPVVIGILMLMGIVTKNAIMLVDFAVEEQKQGVSKTEAMIDAGRKRARPIVMTTIAMAAGMVPAALAIGDGGEFRAPMAIAVIGGLLVSTLLSLVFVPSFYSIMDSVTIAMSRFLHWIFAFNEPDDPELDAARAREQAQHRPDNTDLPLAAE